MSHVYAKMPYLLLQSDSVSRRLVLSKKLYVCLPYVCRQFLTMSVTQRLSSRQCGVPIHPRDPQIAVIRDVFISISAFFIVIRIFVKCSHWGGKWWCDDYLIIAAFVCLTIYISSPSLADDEVGHTRWPICWYYFWYFITVHHFKNMSNALLEVKFGLGTDIWDLESSDITRFLIVCHSSHKISWSNLVRPFLWLHRCIKRRLASPR